MRRIETFQNILTSFCCIGIIITQFLHISTTLVPEHCQLLPVTSPCSRFLSCGMSVSKLGATTTGLRLQAPAEVVQ